MGGMSLVASKKKKNRVHASGTVKKKRKPGHVLYESVSSSGTKKVVHQSRRDEKVLHRAAVPAADPGRADYDCDQAASAEDSRGGDDFNAQGGAGIEAGGARATSRYGRSRCVTAETCC